MLRKLTAALVFFVALIATALPAFASSTVTASARQYTAATSEFHSIADAAWNSPTTGSFSVGGWIYLTDISANRPIWSKDFGGAGTRTFFLMANATPDYRFGLSSDGTNLTVKSSATATSTGAWILVVGVFDNSGNTIGISINGANLETTAFTGDAYDTTSALEIGRYARDAGPTHMNGRQMGLFYYSKALSNAEIAALYNSGNGLLYKDLSTAQKTSLEAWYDGAETSGVLIDASGNGRHMTDNNTVTSAAGKVTYTANSSNDFVEADGDWLSISDAAQTGLSTGDLNDDFYVCGWANLRAFTSGTASWLWMKANNNTNANFEWQVRYDNSANTFYGYVGIDTTEYAGPATVSFSNFEFGVWAFVEFWADASAKTVYCSVNRGTAATATWTGTAMRGGTAPVTIGTHGNLDNAGNNMDGQIANVVFIQGIPTDSEKDALYNRGFGVDYSDRPTLSTATYISWWPLTENSGTREDIHGSNDLTATGTPNATDGIIYDVPAASARRIIS